MRAANAKLRAYSDAHGAFALQEAISRGQYRHADGVYFGGARESWSGEALQDVLKFYGFAPQIVQPSRSES